jgi:hypothetical protein
MVFLIYGRIFSFGSFWDFFNNIKYVENKAWYISNKSSFFQKKISFLFLSYATSTTLYFIKFKANFYTY